MGPSRMHAKHSAEGSDKQIKACLVMDEESSRNLSELRICLEEDFTSVSVPIIADS